MTVCHGLGKLKYFQRYEAFSTFVLFICLSAYALGANPFSGETVAPFDRLLQFSGWSTIPSDRTAVHAERSDILDSQLPTWITLKDQIRKEESPLWYPNGAGGQPISLELCNPAFLLFVLIKDNALAYYLVGLAKLVISGFGVYLLLRIFLQWLPAIWGGMVFMLCGFNAAWLLWEQTTTAMWIPWLLWATVMYLRTDDKKWLPAITVISLLLIFGGFPPIAAFGFYSFFLVLLIWQAYDFFFNDQRKTYKNAAILGLILKKTALPLLAVGISFVMSAITIIPFRDGMAGINLGYRTGGTPFSISDLPLFLSYENPPRVETTVYIGFLACILALGGIFSAFRTNDENLKRFIFVDIFLVIITILIAFDLLPHQLMRALPVFSSNNWGRLVVVTLLALSALSAIGLNYIYMKLRELSAGYLRLTPLNAHYVIAIALIGVIAIQFHAQKKLFNGFNAVVPAAWFYPLTPSIKYVKEHLQPLQSVIADASSYWFAGTLGAYGIPEWYAHSFRTDREKEVLGELAYNRSKSPTTMVIDGKSIHFDSPLMEKLAIKYLLVSKDVGDKRLLELPELSHEPAPPLPYNSWKQHIDIPKDMTVGAIGFSFYTYGSEHAPANVRLTIYKDNSEKYFGEAELGKNEINITEKKWAFFPLPDKTFLSKGGYYVVLSLPGYTGAKSLSAWATKTRSDSGSFLEINGAKTDLSLTWKIGYFQDMDLVLKKWNLIDLEKDIVIYENKRVTNSAYFIRDLDPLHDQLDFSAVDIRQQSIDLIDVAYSKKEAGWVVLPMHFDPGWKAYVGKRQVKYDRYLDMLPAIPVSGPAHVVFAYKPESFRKGVTVALIGVFIFLVFSGICLRKAKQGP